MNGIVLLLALFILFGVVLGAIAFVAYRRVLRRAKGVERGLKMVPLLIHLPPPSEDVENTGTRSEIDIMRTRVSEAQTLYDLIAGTSQKGFKSSFYGQRHIAFEIVASNGLVHYFAAVPIALVSVVEQAIVTSYPGARLEEVEDHNIFNPQGHLTGTVGGELVLQHDAAYPIATLDKMERDPMVGILNSLSKLQLGDGAAIQIMLRPARSSWINHSIKLVAKKRHTRQGGLGFGVLDVLKGAVKTSEEWREKAKTFEVPKLEEEMLQAIEEKTKHPGYEVLVRVLVSSPTYDRSQMLLRALTASFALYDAPGSNGFQFIEGRDMRGLVTAFIFRFFPPELKSTILNSVELATVFHLPDAQFTPTTQVERQQSKQVDGPVNMPAGGLLMGYNFYRGVKKEIRLSPEDRRRHTYIIGQTGTGKSTILENLAVQDMLAGNGFAFIDPHGDTAEKLISMVPKERAEDVIYFNPGDMERPLGLNLFEFSDPSQKDFLIQESINMLYKLYDPTHQGIIGPRFEHWFRNAALTLMADPNGASFIEIPKVFTDSAYLKNKFKYLTDPTVIDFWTKEMGQTSDYHKSEMLGFFVSKFGAFQSNDMMRNIIGQTHSAFNLREIMDNKKILIVNLGKGLVGELNAQLLGMMFVMKFQAAAMSRASVPEDQRQDFSLFVDEFQNFSTDSFASILSEARKYHLNLIVANQFIGQLTDEIRDAVFGNVGTIMSYRCGPEDAEFLVKQFQPIFDERDLVNLPNYNAVMKLLIGGLPSQPFSITALPPLGKTNAEMGLAIKQLSAAKFGVGRAAVEADIFARLQNQPKPVTPNAATDSVTPPASAAPAAASKPPTGGVPGLTTEPAASVEPAAPVPPPAPIATPAPAAAASEPDTTAEPVSVSDPAEPQSAPEPEPKPEAPKKELNDDPHADMLPPVASVISAAPPVPKPDPASDITSTSAQKSEQSQATPSVIPDPEPEPPGGPAGAPAEVKSSEELSLSQLSQDRPDAPSLEPTKSPEIQPPKAQPEPEQPPAAPRPKLVLTTPIAAKADVAANPINRPDPLKLVADLTSRGPSLRIEAHETDGKTNPPPAAEPPTKAKPEVPTLRLLNKREPVLVASPPTKPTKRIEAVEKDGIPVAPKPEAAPASTLDALDDSAEIKKPEEDEFIALPAPALGKSKSPVDQPSALEQKDKPPIPPIEEAAPSPVEPVKVTAPEPTKEKAPADDASTIEEVAQETLSRLQAMNEAGPAFPSPDEEPEVFLSEPPEPATATKTMVATHRTRDSWQPKSADLGLDESEANLEADGAEVTGEGSAQNEEYSSLHQHRIKVIQPLENIQLQPSIRRELLEEPEAATATSTDGSTVQLPSVGAVSDSYAASAVPSPPVMPAPDPAISALLDSAPAAPQPKPGEVITPEGSSTVLEVPTGSDKAPSEYVIPEPQEPAAEVPKLELTPLVEAPAAEPKVSTPVAPEQPTQTESVIPPELTPPAPPAPVETPEAPVEVPVETVPKEEKPAEKPEPPESTEPVIAPPHPEAPEPPESTEQPASPESPEESTPSEPPEPPEPSAAPEPVASPVAALPAPEAAAPVMQPVGGASRGPKLQPGEIFVDENGNVVQG